MRRDKLTLFVLILLIATLPLGVDRLRARAHSEWSEAQSYEDVYYLPPTDWMPAFSLGWHEAAADLVWMRALIYYGDEMVHHGDVEFVYRYAEAIERLDPNFVAVYSWVGTAGLYRPQAITVADVERTVEFMQRGADRFPYDGELAWQLGSVLAFELPPMLNDEEAANRARERAAPLLMRATRLGAAPEWSALTNAAILGRIGQTDLAIRHIQEVMEHTSDPAQRERLITRLRQLDTRRSSEAAVAMSQDLEDRRYASFPYAPTSFFILLGPRPPDLDAPTRDGVAAAFAFEE